MQLIINGIKLSFTCKHRRIVYVDSYKTRFRYNTIQLEGIDVQTTDRVSFETRPEIKHIKDVEVRKKYSLGKLPLDSADVLLVDLSVPDLVFHLASLLGTPPE